MYLPSWDTWTPRYLKVVDILILLDPVLVGKESVSEIGRLMENASDLSQLMTNRFVVARSSMICSCFCACGMDVEGNVISSIS